MRLCCYLRRHPLAHLKYKIRRKRNLIIAGSIAGALAAAVVVKVTELYIPSSWWTLRRPSNTDVTP